ncbi:RluA family pseudouridine synthase [Leptospira broomii]|uniref:RluA family pseudouridine synthase n=1 Tax=Leptospira broomii TaxID=301541 RepID=UPI000287DD60|nr:RluA family pseudouridine synthase [Leptospira broomii]
MDLFLAKRFTYLSRSSWKKHLSDGNILLDGKPCKASHILREGEEVEYLPSDFPEPSVDTRFSLLYDEERFFAVNKSGDLPVHAAGRYRKNNLVDILESDGRFGRPYLVNRLDRETSGIVLFGKDAETASRLASFFSTRKVHKIYTSLVWGNFPKRLTASGWLGPDAESKIRKKRAFYYSTDSRVPQIPTADWETSSTDFRLVGGGFLDGKRFSRILCFPKTGRNHQIRATLYSLGFPLIGDKLYGVDETVFLDFIEGKQPNLIDRLGRERQALHAISLKFPHPYFKKRINIFSPIPEDMRA